MKKCNIILHTLLAVCEVLIIIPEIWSLINDDVATKWTGFVAGLSCAILASLFIKNIRMLCKM